MSDQSDAMTKLAMACVLACMTGNKTITLTLKAKRSREFPRGELLSVGSDGIRDQNAKAREGGK